MRSSSTRVFIWLSFVVLLLVPLSTQAQEGYVVTTYASGLQSPRGLTLDTDGNLVAALVGSGTGYRDARVVRFRDRNGDGQANNGAEIKDLVNNLPTVSFTAEDFGDAKFGVSDARIGADGSVAFVTNLLVEDFYRTGWTALWSTNAPSIYRSSLQIASPYAHFMQYETDHNPDGDLIDSNPYALELADDGTAYVTDAAANAVFKVTTDGTITTYAVIHATENPTDVGPEMIDAAPTGIVWGPDSALYVGLETGYPWIEGSSTVWRLEDTNGDGDALDTDEMTPYLTGLTTVTDVTFDNQGRLLATEFRGFLTGEDAPSGRVMRWDNGGWDVIASGLTTPTGITVGWDDTIYVSQEFIGQISAIRAQ
ncbi:MAG TPA: ScyD/ScyE family protein [Thermomicrobiales bacterium]|nr:ScyD/ScyE family protein [Thermomicrobiales bacterium]